VDAARMGRNGQLFMDGAEAIGASGSPLSRSAGRCIQCSSCPMGCRLDAKRAMHVTYLPRAVEAGARVRAGVQVDRVLLEGSRAAGVSCSVDSEAPPRLFEVRARTVISAGGAFGTPELLMRSGLGAANGTLGGNLHLHPAAWIGARFDEEVRGWDGIMQSYCVDEWFDRGLMLEATFTPLAFGAQWLPGVGREHQERMLAYDRVASTGVHLSDRSSGRVGLAGDGSLRISYRLSRAEAATLTYGIARAAEIFFAAGAREVYPQVSGSPTIRPGGVAAFETTPPRPSELRLEAFHPMGTAAMGGDPARSVTTPSGAVRGVEDLFVADASLLPTSLGVNPMMTVIACASRIAGRLAERLS
jgi:choline dehydrogenase-like flavoprotein